MSTQDFDIPGTGSLWTRVRRALAWAHPPQTFAQCPDCLGVVFDEDLPRHRRRMHRADAKRPQDPGETGSH